MPYLLAALAVVAGAVLWLLRSARHSLGGHRSDLEWLPADLLDATLVWSEKAFRCRWPTRMAVRIDRAYRSADNELVLIEFKRRAVRRVHLSDRVELSVQRYVLQQAGHVVGRRAYVVVIVPDGRCSRALPVELEDAQQVQSRVARLVALRERRASPRGPMHPAVCAGCGHRDVCPRRPQ